MAFLPDNPLDIESALRRLASDIREKEAQIAALSKELHDLQLKARKLDEARAILIEASGTADQRLELAVQGGTHSLQGDIIRALSEFAASGASVMDIMDRLEKQDPYRYANKRNFYSAVHVTLKRCIAKGLVDQVDREGQKLYFPAPPTVRYGLVTRGGPK